MNQHRAIPPHSSLLERAADLYDFSSQVRPPVLPARPAVEARPFDEPAAEAPLVLTKADVETRRHDDAPAAAPSVKPVARLRGRRPAPAGRVGTVDRNKLQEQGFILPDAAVTGLAEEFRIVKRQLLLATSAGAGLADDKRQTILVCSAQPDEGKTFCAINLALSLAGEKDVEVLLVDGDFAKPEILSILGLEAGPGLIDAISDPQADVDAYVIKTDIPGLSVLPAGRQANDVTELLASERTRDVLADLTQRHPNRVVIFDSPPALVASPASVLAAHAGQVMMVVRADQTTEADLREALGLLSGCDSVSLLLNGAGLAASGRRFGSYYGYGQ